MRSLFLTFLVLIALTTLALPSYMPAKAASVLDGALNVGDTIPVLTTLDSAGHPVTLETISGEKGAIFMFVRSLDWCRYCKVQVNEWNIKADAFVEAGYPVSIISYDKPETSQLFTKSQNITMKTLYDKDSKMIKAFGILNDKYDADSRFYGIPHPFIYVINKNGKITHRYAEESYQDRPSADTVLEALSKK